MDTKIESIDYIGVLNYLIHNAEKPYSKPDAEGIEPDEKDRLLDLKEKGQYAVGEMKKMADAFGTLYKLNKCMPLSWLDGSNTKTKKYLWAQLKYKQYADNPVSISLFAEQNGEKSNCYRVSLEIKNDSADKIVMEKYHSHLDIPLNKDAGLVYISGSNKWGRPGLMEESQSTIREMIENNKVRKVQICKYINRKPDETNEYYHEEISKAIKSLIPYYEHVIGDAYTNTDDEDIDMDREQFDHNMILYGPPGTGKTYNTAIYAVAICDGKSLDEVNETDYDEVMKRYNELKEAGRVAFTTFHQSYGYEEFIEGIKPVVDSDSNDIGYTIEPGVFKAFCEESKLIKNDDTECTGKVWNFRNRSADKEVGQDYEEKLYAEGMIQIENIEDHNRQCGFFNDMASGDWVVLGRNYNIDAIGVITDDEPEEIDDGIFHYQRSVNWLATDLDIDCRKINQGKGFSNFAIAQSKMKVQDLQKYIYLDVKNDEPYVFIIDEINRGNISKIFGELITLIENTKREGMPEAASAILPYSNEEFSVPSNVYILGTMNTADRSIALMDTALRRRFQFVEMMPDSDVLDGIMVEGLNIGAMLDVINERIKFLYDREHTIGHAFFTGLRNEPTIEKLASIFEKYVIPLLQEYFYEDYQKIQLVLGDNGKTEEEAGLKFIKDTKVVAKDIFVGSVEDIVDLPEKKYEINKAAFLNIDSYKKIGKGL